jgi:CheY-like chemotaxis protein
LAGDVITWRSRGSLGQLARIRRASGESPARLRANRPGECLGAGTGSAVTTTGRPRRRRSSMITTATTRNPHVTTCLVHPFAHEPGRVFLAEDDPFLRNGLLRAFGAHGFEVIAAPNGSVMLDSLRHFRDWNQDQRSVLVTDLDMPLVGGVELARQAALEGWRFPVVFMSGDPAPDVVEKAKPGTDLAHGVRFFAKPFSLRDLLATVAAVMPPQPSP